MKILFRYKSLLLVISLLITNCCRSNNISVMKKINIKIKNNTEINTNKEKQITTNDDISYYHCNYNMNFKQKSILLILCNIILVSGFFYFNYYSNSYLILDKEVSNNYIELKKIHNQNLSFWVDEYDVNKLKNDFNQTFYHYSQRKDKFYPMKQYKINFESSTIDFMNQFKDPKLGALMSLYWEARMISFFSKNFDFNIIKASNTLLDKRKYDIFHDKNHYCSFLPTFTNIHAVDIFNNNEYEKNKYKFEQYIEWILMWNYQSKRKSPYTLYAYGLDTMNLLVSHFFVNIIQTETNEAFNKYYKFHKKEKQKNYISNQMWINKIDDVLIHVRCQDVLLHGAGGYGVSSIQYYYNAIKLVLNTSFHENMAIHLVSFIRNKQQDKTDQCYNFLYNFLLKEMKKVFYPIQIKLITNGTIDDDFYRFTQAPNMICGTSSYCIMGALANKNNVILAKKWTPQEWYKYSSSFNVIAQNIHYLDDPNFITSQYIKKHKLGVKEIAEKIFKLNKEISKKNKTII